MPSFSNGKVLKRSFSLKRHKEFHYTYRAGKRVGQRSFTLVWAKNRPPRLQVGFSVSKKVGNSVERNRCKRRLKAALDFFMSNIRPGFNLILVARREALFTPFEMLKGEIERSVRKAGLWQDKAEAAEA